MPAVAMLFDTEIQHDRYYYGGHECSDSREKSEYEVYLRSHGKTKKKKKIAYISDECKERNTEKVEKDDGQQKHDEGIESIDDTKCGSDNSRNVELVLSAGKNDSGDDVRDGEKAADRVRANDENSEEKECSAVLNTGPDGEIRDEEDSVLDCKIGGQNTGPLRSTYTCYEKVSNPLYDFSSGKYFRVTYLADEEPKFLDLVRCEDEGDDGSDEIDYDKVLKELIKNKEDKRVDEIIQLVLTAKTKDKVKKCALKEVDGNGSTTLKSSSVDIDTTNTQTAECRTITKVMNHVDDTCTGSTTFTSSSVEINTTNVTKDEGPRGIGPPLLRSVQCVDYGFLRGTNMNNAIEEDAYNGGNGDESLDQDGNCDIKLENTNPKEKHKDGPKDMKEKRKDKDGPEHVKSKEMHEDKRNPDQENQSTEDQTTEQTFFGVMIEPDSFYGQKLVTNKDRRKLEFVKFNRVENWLSGCSISDTSSELNVSS